MVPGTYLPILVKIRSVTAKIFLIWTNVTSINVAWTSVTLTVGICSWCSQEPIFKVSSKSVQLELRYSWFGQMSRGQMLPRQMSPWQSESVLDVHMNLPLKFHQNQVSNSWDIPDMYKCREEKCCVDKCHPYSWNLF